MILLVIYYKIINSFEKVKLVKSSKQSNSLISFNVTLQSVLTLK